MMKVFTLLSLLSFAFGQEGEPICEFAIKMFSTDAENNCFEGWSMLQTEELAGPLLESWQQREYPNLIDEQEECTSLVTLTVEQYNGKSDDEKFAYRKSQERCGLNIGYDKNYAYCMDQGYREGWDIEYTNKTANVNPDYEPIGLPSVLLPQPPSPLPQELTYEGDLHWFKTNYLIGWDKGCVEGKAQGKIEGKAAGKLARERGDDYHFANLNGYRKGYNDALLNLTALHEEPARNRNRQLRGVERKMREEYAKGYSEGYNEAMEAEEAARQLKSVERNLVAKKTCTQACIKYHSDTTLNTNQWNTCKMVVRACRNMRRRQLQEGVVEYEWNHVDTLPTDGEQGGADFKNLLAHLLEQNCDIADVVFEVWKMCPLGSAAPTPAPIPLP